MDNSRRDFCKKSLMILSALSLSAVNPKEVFAQADPTTAVDGAKNPMVAAVGYVADGTKSDKRKDASQNCKGCALYQKGGLTVAGQTGEYGKCALFMDGLVAANGWCQSWAPKAG
jgi:hypothetical protein